MSTSVPFREERGATEGCVVNVVSTLPSQRHVLILPPSWNPGSVKLAGMSAMQGVNGGRRASTMGLESGLLL